MVRSPRTHRSLVTFRPHLEKLEDRSQPGSLLSDLAGWSLLGASFGVLDFDTIAERASLAPRSEGAAPLDAATVPIHAGRLDSTHHAQADTGFATMPVLAPSAGAELLQTVAAVDASPIEDGEGGGSIAKYDGTWYTLADMPTRRQEVATAVLNGEIYVIGGFNSNGQATNTVEVYNPKTDTWRSAAPLPIVNDHGAAANILGALVAFGGQSNRVFVYWPEGDQWYDIAPMRYRHGGTPAVGILYDDYLIVAGGTGPGMVGNEVEIYDPYNNVWIDLAPMNVPRNHTAGGVIDNQFYVAAGRGTAQSGSALEVYDPSQNTWTRLPNLPTARSGVAGAVVYDCLYIFGGETPGVFSQVEYYDPNAGAWQSATPMQTPRHGIFASVIDNAVYIPGGATQEGFGATNTNEVFVIG